MLARILIPMFLVLSTACSGCGGNMSTPDVPAGVVEVPIQKDAEPAGPCYVKTSDKMDAIESRQILVIFDPMNTKSFVIASTAEGKTVLLGILSDVGNPKGDPNTVALLFVPPGSPVSAMEFSKEELQTQMQSAHIVRLNLEGTRIIERTKVLRRNAIQDLERGFIVLAYGTDNYCGPIKTDAHLLQALEPARAVVLDEFSQQ